MPDLVAPKQLPFFDLERAPYLDKEVSDAAALRLVVDTFNYYSSERKSIEERWRQADALYHGVVQKRVWEGTNIPRSSLPVMLVYDQIEAAYPQLVENLFDHYPTFFDVEATQGTEPRDAVRVRDGIADILDTPFDMSGLTALPHLGRALHQAQKYGDGVVEISWDATLKRFIVEHVDIRDFYMDPKTKGPVVDWSKAVIRRKMVSVEQLRQLRGTKGFSIPDDDRLNFLASKKYWEHADHTRQAAAQMRMDFSQDAPAVNPVQRDVEVLFYWTKDRLIWVLGREVVAVNEANPYGFLPFAKAPFTVVDDQPYSMSLADALETDQKYAQGIRNGRLDNLALAMHPPRSQALGVPTKQSDAIWRPGMLQQVNDPKDVVIHPVENFTAAAFQEEEMIHRDAMRKTGINELAQSGVPTPSNANRSATGVAKQASASSTRLRTAVKNFEDYLIVPMLYKIVRMMQKLGPEQIELPSGGVLDKADIERPMKWKMSAASRMVIRERLIMVLGPVTQFIFNPDVARQANLQGKTLDFDEWERFLQEATATAKIFKFFRPMTEQEQAALNQPDPKLMAEMQMKQQDAQTRMAIAQNKTQTELQKVQIQAQGKSSDAAESSAVEILKLLIQEFMAKKGEKAESRQMMNDMMMKTADMAMKKEDHDMKREDHQMKRESMMRQKKGMM